MGIEIDRHYLTTLLFADDQVIIARDEQNADYMFRKLIEKYRQLGLNINRTKTEQLKAGESQIRKIPFTVVKNETK